MPSRYLLIAVNVLLMIGSGCLEDKKTSVGPQSLSPALTALPLHAADQTLDALCRANKDTSALQAIDYEWLTLEAPDAPTPTSHEELKVLSRLAYYQLASSDPKHQLSSFIEAAGRRLGFPPSQLIADLTTAGRIELWNLKIPHEPRRIGRFPACQPSDFNPSAFLPKSPLEQLASFKLNANYNYLNLGKASIKHTWAALKEASQFSSPSIPAPQEILYSVHPLRQEARTAELKLLTFNTALLDYKLFGFLSVRSAPDVDARRDAILKSVFLHDDIVAFQELWSPDEAPKFAAEAQVHGFDYFNPTKAHASNGLGLAIRQSLIDSTFPIEHDVVTFPENLPKEYWAAELTSFGSLVGIKRGFQSVRFRNHDGVVITVINTHFTAYRENWRMRLAQAQHLASFVMAVQSDIVIVMGDLNGDIHYASDTFTDPEGKITDQWLPNAYSTPLLTATADLDDWSTLGFGRSFLEDCYSLTLESRDTRCQPTWDHRNTVVKEQYPISNEPMARLDFILGRSNRPIAMPEASLAFTEVIDLTNGKESQLSDHMGVRVRLVYQPDTRNPKP